MFLPIPLTMKKLILLAFCTIPFIAFSQNEYKASNGKVYHVGDTVKIALGSMADGSFKYVQASQPSFLPPRRSSNDLNARKDMANSFVMIKKIKNGDRLSDRVRKTVFVVKTNGILNLDIWIEEAIAACEVTPCADTHYAQAVQPLSIADELLKLKKLLDSGTLTQDEFNAQKKKLLSN